jgi:hypothetical protein
MRGLRIADGRDVSVTSSSSVTKGSGAAKAIRRSDIMRYSGFNSAYWQGFYREEFVDEAGRTVRKRVAVSLGALTEIPNEKAGQTDRDP